VSDEDIRSLERLLENGSETDVERYLTEKIRRSPDLVRKLVRRVIRLERVVVLARANEEHYHAPVTTRDFLSFLETEAPDRPRHPGVLIIEGEWPESGDAPRGGRVTLQGAVAVASVAMKGR
jgi:hypothetical protein